MTDLSVEERLLHYFLAMGAQQTTTDSKAGADLSLTLGHEMVHVIILKNTDLVQRGKVLQSILKLAFLRGPSNQLYLAAPRLLGATIDAEVFRPYGIGLLLFDERHIDETIAPQSLPASHQASPVAAADGSVLTELATLKSMYLEMQRNFETLREEIKSFQTSVDSLPTGSRPSRQPDIVAPHPVFVNNEGELPSFFANNPWLEVLSRRGKKDHPLAG